MSEKVYTIEEAAVELGLSPVTLRHQARVGKLPTRRIGWMYVVTEEGLATYREQSLGRRARRVEAPAIEETEA